MDARIEADLMMLWCAYGANPVIRCASMQGKSLIGATEDRFHRQVAGYFSSRWTIRGLVARKCEILGS